MDRQLDVEKAVVYVDEEWPRNITAGFPLRAILVPRVVPGLVEAHIYAASPSAVFQMHTQRQDSLARMRRLVQAVPCFVLELGSDMASIPDAISGLLGRLASEADA